MQATPKKSFDTPQCRSPMTPFSVHSRSPSYDDSGSCGRFIPNRTASNLVNAFDRCDDTETTGKTPIAGERERRFSSLLHNQLFGSDITNTANQSTKALPVYRYKPATPGSPWTNKENVQTALLPSHDIPTLVLPGEVRSLPRSPFKVLDAPQLPDDFYLNLLDWSFSDVLAVGLGPAVYLWSAASSSVSCLVDLPRDTVCSVSWTPTGDSLAVGDSAGRVHLYDVQRGVAVRTMEGHKARVSSLAWADGVLSSGSKDRFVLQRDVRAREDYVSRLGGHKQEVCGLKWSPDSTLLASGGNDNRIFLWSLHSPAPVHCFASHTAAVKALAWSPQQRGVLVSGGGTVDRCIRFWNTVSGVETGVVDTGSQVSNLLFSRNGGELVSTHGYSQNQVVVWRSSSMTKVGELFGHTSRVLYLAVSASGENIVTGAGDETLRFWKVFPRETRTEKLSRLTPSFLELR